MASDRGSKITDYALADFMKTNPIVQAGSNSFMCFDQQPFFSTLHPTNGGDAAADVPTGVAATQSNLDLSTPLTVSNFAIAFAKMLSYVDETGRPWDVMPDTLFVGPALRHVAKQICDSDMIADIAAAAGASTTVSASSVPAMQRNVEQNTVKLQIIPDLAYAPGAWILAQTKGIVKPFVWAQLEAPHLIPSVDPQSTNVFLKQEFWYSVEALAEIAPTLWPLANYATSGTSFGT
jgi:phage major head subunit gpT-like protein